MNSVKQKLLKFVHYIWLLLISILVILYLPIGALVNLFSRFVMSIIIFTIEKLLRKETKFSKVDPYPIRTFLKFISRKVFKKEIKIEMTSFRKTRVYLEKYWLGEGGRAQNNRTFVYFLMPSLSAFIIVVFVPFVLGIYYSMTNFSGLNQDDLSFIWFDNYKNLVQDYKFMYSFYRTALYAVLNILAINIVAFFLAILVTQKLKLKNLYRAGFFMPNLIGGLVLGYIWQFVFNKAVVQFAGVMGNELLSTSILSSTSFNNSALYGLILVITWQYAGYIMMIYIAAIQNIPQSLIEASKIDGANALQRLRHITVPLVAQAFTVALFLTLVTSFKQYDTVMSLTQGGPAALMPEWIANMYDLNIVIVRSTELIAVNIYKEAFTNYNMGIGQAKAIVFFSILLVFSLLQVYWSKKREVEL